MAPLTWRNVDAPSFSGPNEMWRLAANLMNQGFDRARQGLTDFRDITTEEQSAAMMQQVAAAGDDPAAIQAAIAGGNPAFLSPQAIQFANNQPGVLLDREGKRLSNTGEGLQNTIRGQNIRANDYNFDYTARTNARTEADIALRPEAMAEMTRLRTAFASGNLTPEQQSQMQADFVAKYGSALGINDASSVGSFMTTNQGAFTTQQQDSINRLQNDDTLNGLILNRDARGIAANVLTQFPDIATATRAIQGFQNMDPETKTAAISALSGMAAAIPERSAADQLLERNSTLFPDQAPARPPLPQNYQPITYANQNARRNLPLNSNLTNILNTVLPNYGVTARVTSGGQVTAAEAAAGLGTRTNSSTTNHDHGGAGDVNLIYNGRELNWENPNDVPILQAIVSDIRRIDPTSQFGAGPNYMNPRTTHIGTGRSAVWGAEGGAPYQALLDAFNGAQSTAASGRGPTVERAAATAAVPQYQAAMDAISNGQTYEAPINPNLVSVAGADGTPTAERTFTTEIGGAFFNIPTTVNGRELPEDQALAEFRAGTNPAVGVYQTRRAAEDAAASRADRVTEMLASSTAATNTSQETQQTAQNVALTEAATPTLQETTSTGTSTPQPARVDETQEIRINDRWTIPGVDPSGSNASQDWQRAQRNSAIGGVIESIKTNLATSEGAAPLPGFIGNTWDYFMASPEDAAANRTSREAAGEALTWFQSSQARDYFRQNPQALVEAQANPVEFARNFGQTEDQRAYAASTSGTNQQGTGAQSTEARTPEFVRRQLTAAETIDQMFSTVTNTDAINAANDQYASVRVAIQAAPGNNESAAAVARRLTGDDGVLADYDHSNVTTALQQVSQRLGIKPSVAAALLEEKGTYDKGWLGGWLGGIGSGYELDDDAMADLYGLYQEANNANRGISSMNANDLTEYQRTQVAALQTQVTEAQTTLRAAIADPNTPPERRALYEQQLAQLTERVRALLGQIIGSGAVDSNIRNKPPQ